MSLFDLLGDACPPAPTARFSPCGVYRYRLTREIAGGIGACTFVMLNPSTATAEVDDPTIRRCIGFARSWGFGRLVVVNLFALRSTDPAALSAHAEPIGPDNDAAIVEASLEATRVICAWGAHGSLRGRDAHVARLLLDRDVPLHALAVTKYGAPGHPLYLPKDARPARWAPRGRSL